MFEDNNSSFNILSQTKAVNHDIIVMFTPNENVKKIEYQIIYNDETQDTITVNTIESFDILLNKTGKYEIKVTTYDYKNRVKIYETGIYNIDKEAPVINLDNEGIVEFKAGTIYNFKEDGKAYDKQDGDLTYALKTNEEQIDFSTPGLKEVIYTVSDSAGNTTSRKINVNVLENNSQSLFFVQMLIIFILFIISFVILRYRKSMRLEQRIAKYSIEPIKDESLSLMDEIIKKYFKRTKKISSFLKKSVFLTKYSKKYEKFTAMYHGSILEGMDFVTLKLFVSIIFLIVAIFSKTIQYQLLSMYEVCFPLIIGFFVPDIIFYSKYKIHRTKVENDLLQAIIIMNNAFKSGRSISQAILLVSTELDGPISEEFKKMHLELSYGLGVDVVFKRFSERINLEEVTYLTASLTVLNRTGGNIIKVFSSIEKNLFNKKKLKLELKSLTGSSKIIVYVLFAVPMLFVLFISLISPTYFVPLFTTPLGLIILSAIIVMYIIYIIFVNKIMKVRM